MNSNDPQDPNDLSQVGTRLRATRQQLSMTIAEAAEATGISRSTLSRLENGGRRPTLELLMPLARLYRVALDDLVGAPQTGDPRIDIRPLYRGGAVHLRLGGDGEKGVTAFKHVIPGVAAGRRPESAPRQHSHPGREWVFVLAGTLRLVLDGSEYLIEPGEVAEFECTVPHWFGAGGETAVEYLGLSSPGGEKVHLTPKT
ncbi:MAG: helix-turn-helix domain-containing protein [Corynebacterium sp.]|uniref:helix-turn-helix domain-containing protein n=1 Tax=unclassified Corynebacterium TaxID=2624378 RepID=UPI002648DDFE|nr:helix-turn-helix transcriptional regulator [Corynebacterium sp.]MDN5582125.1 helix-turn-helix transcriptional regulator [Corynebacterium sp.]MDN5720149.1 helix-turn-helix transcriptional regulator [Corynebacterium sp.]MDN6258593.1 helix-turn-helix transcriptional regulator [Corynebacterium sp.]MDN6324236.1 helix-turn-helix transcriptional regulator [Corynebacterium sp.]MDN6509794.1 helix-turn-helix transcriptional regulator [Corynebacterium sp.]